MSRGRTLAIGVPLTLAAVLLAMVTTDAVTGYLRFLVTEMAILALLATSFNLVYGFGGMLSFCQGSFYGLGAYLTAWVTVTTDISPLMGLPLSLLGCGVVAFLLGLLLVRMGGHSFTIATVIIAVGALLAGNTFRELTGGEDGISIAERVAGILTVVPVQPALAKLYPSMAILASVLVVLTVFLRSVPGKILVAIRESELRARFLGYNVCAWRLGVFTAAGALAGLAGALYALTAGHVSTTTLDISLSVNAILWAAVGGLGTVLGPTVGVAILVPLTEYFSTRLAALAQIPVGILLLVVITLMPDGILGWWHQRCARVIAPVVDRDGAVMEVPRTALKETRQ
jgi:branched-chain amino acid transport system permease protein